MRIITSKKTSPMKNTIALLAVSVFFATPSFAQNSAEENEDAKKEEAGESQNDTTAPKEESKSATLNILKQKNCLYLVNSSVPLKAGFSYSIKLPEAAETRAIVRKANQNRAQLLAQPKNKKCAPNVGKSITLDLSSAQKAAPAKTPTTKPSETATAENSTAISEEKPSDKKDTVKKPKEAEKTDSNKAASAPRQKQYRIDAGGGYLMFFQKVDASNPFNLEAKKQSVTSIGGLSYYGGLQASIPLANGNNVLIGGRYQMYSASKEIELGSGSPSFKYSLKMTELVLKPGYSFSTCFGIGFTCAVMGVAAKSNSADVRMGAVDEPPLSDLTYMRFGGGALLQTTFTEGFDGFFEIEGSTSSGTLKRGDTEKKFEVAPQFFVLTGGVNFSL